MRSQRAARARARLVALATLGLLPLFSGACSEAPERPQPRLVVLYATCTLNKSYLGPYGGTEYTPALDAFADEAVVFERHQTESGQSGISFASIFSGTQSWKHGIYDHPNQLREELYLIPEAFRDAGYDTYYWTGHQMADYGLGYGQGVEASHVFDSTEGKRKREKLWSFLQPGNPLFEQMLARFDEDPDYRAFVLCNFTVTHGKYHRQAPDEWYDVFLRSHPNASKGLTRADLEAAWELYDMRYRAEGEERQWRFDLQWGYDHAVTLSGKTEAELQAFHDAIEVTYAADVAFLDRMFGNTVQALRDHGLYDQSLIAFTADHGETLYREGTLFKYTHGLQLAPEVLEVPWLIRSPLHGTAGGRYPELTSSIDVYPTVAGLCGIDLTGKGIQGRDLSGALLGEVDRPREPAFSHTTKIGGHMEADFARWSQTRRFFATSDVDRIWARIREEDVVYKYRNFGEDRWGLAVFDLAADPLESTDLADLSDPKHAEMQEALEAYKQLLEQCFRDPGNRPEGALEDLKELGYAE